MTEKRHQWASNLGFILAAAGSAVGLGNIWKFPGKVGAYGGGAFLIPYFLFVALFSYVGLSGEFALGRLTGTGAMGSLDYVLRQRGRRGGRRPGRRPTPQTPAACWCWWRKTARKPSSGNPSPRTERSPAWWTAPAP